MDLVSIFNQVRDLPYRIRLSSSEKELSCGGKHCQLKKILTQGGLESRYRVGTFRWSALNLPPALLAIPHQDEGTHVFLEVKISDRWVKVDASWDRGLKNILPVNEWDGHFDCTVAVPIIETFSPAKSEQIMLQWNQETISVEDKNNGQFYRAFNKWLEENRQS